VHFHGCFEEGPFLDAASTNLITDAVDSSMVHAVICLTESSDADWFERLTKVGPETKFGSSQWQIRATREANSLLAIDSRGQKMAIIAGRQIVCGEGLEVLALGYGQSIDDGQPIRSVMQTVAGSSAVPVVPWGFGKWVGPRGTVVKGLLCDPPCRFLLGDNGGRLAAGGEPVLFGEARERGIDILPGTDPFPFRWDSQRVGSFGIEWDGGLDPGTPYQNFRSLVLSTDSAGIPFGRLETIPAFFRNQIAIQLKKISSKWRR
jgi:hypothetical protein